MADKKPEKKQECVQVVVRCRPFSTKENKENRGNIIGTEAALFQVCELCGKGSCWLQWSAVGSVFQAQPMVWSMCVIGTTEQK